MFIAPACTLKADDKRLFLGKSCDGRVTSLPADVGPAHEWPGEQLRGPGARIRVRRPGGALRPESGGRPGIHLASLRHRHDTVPGVQPGQASPCPINKASLRGHWTL